ncbi:MAG: SHOCT domain-containing protein [Rhodobacteraceae bacterium]|nr:SHOCT domain-containing protein [Paracoccaceae bacterium]MBD3677306.1 SHOCT domain-containing protein [Paracoccaceae bacterium]
MRRFAMLLALSVQPAMADPGEYGHMMDWGYGYGFGMMFGPVLWLIVLGLVVAGVIWLVRRFDAQAPQHGPRNAIVELDMRFAKGEIDAEEYAARKKLLNS